MTSTVLDVTVLLLCVSASVVALGGVGGEGGARRATVDEAADRLVTETVTVRYRASEAANGTRTVHATRASLLALLVADGRDLGDGRGSVQRRDDPDPNGFESRAREAVAAGLDERTRIDATVLSTARRERDGGGPRPGDGSPSAPIGDAPTFAVGAEPPGNVDVATAVVTHPTPSEGGASGPVRIVVRRW
jgi:hypothetical protein